MRKTYFGLFLTLASLPLIGISCGGAEADAGVFRSLNGARTFEQKANAEGGSIATVSVLEIVFNPQNPDQILIGTEDAGFFFSDDQGENWRNVAFTAGDGRAIAVDPQDENVLFLGLDNKIYRSEDGGQTFTDVYTEQTGDIEDILIDKNQTAKLYAVASSGNFLISTDRGESWRATAFIEGLPHEVIVDFANPNLIYVATEEEGVVTSDDGGENFDNRAYLEVRDVVEGFGIMSANDISIDPNDPKHLLVATSFGLIETRDSGTTFSIRPTVVIPETAPLQSVTFHPTVRDAVFMSALNKFYVSSDGADTWSVVDLPTTREVYDIEVKPSNPNEIYIAMKGIGRKTQPIDFIRFGDNND